MHSSDERRTTQNSGICLPGPDGEMYYEDDSDVIHVDNSSDLTLSTSLNDLEITALHIDSQSIDVDAPQGIIDVDEDDDIIDDEDAFPHDLAYSDDDDDDDQMLHEDTMVIVVVMIVPLHTSDHAAYWANYLGELVRELPMHCPSWRQVPAERKARVLAKIGSQFDLKPHMESEHWSKIYTGIKQHLQKIYNGNKSALKAQHWIAFRNDPKNLTRYAQIAKTEQRARSYAGTDPNHLLPFKI
nr:hypothetical protein [Tanacetum cinerariifolium]